MKYSLIIPHFSDPGRLDRLLRTVPVGRQDIEVLVVDDCSLDKSSLDVLKVRWPTVWWLSTDENRGAGGARNVGLARAHGKLLVFADSDDEFLSGAFDVFDEHVCVEDEVVYFLAEAVQEVDGSPSNRADKMNELCMAYLESPSEAMLDRLKLGHVNPVAKVYSRRFVEQIGVNFEETRVSNDVSFNVIAAVQAGHPRVVPVSVYRVIRCEGSLTDSDAVEMLLERMRVLVRLNHRLADLGVSSRMHGGGYIYSSFIHGPSVFIKVFREAYSGGLLWPILKRLSVREVLGFIRRLTRDRKERERM
jgi:glycosyltransferase involved in cell wall biosynthesis